MNMNDAQIAAVLARVNEGRQFHFDAEDVRAIAEALAATAEGDGAVVPDAPLKVFDSGPWIYEPDGMRFSGQQLDGAAFAEYRRLLAAAPAAPRGGVNEAMVERALAAYLRVQDAGESLYGCVTSALTAALAQQAGAQREVE